MTRGNFRGIFSSLNILLFMISWSKVVLRKIFRNEPFSDQQGSKINFCGSIYKFLANIKLNKKELFFTSRALTTSTYTRCWLDVQSIFCAPSSGKFPTRKLYWSPGRPKKSTRYLDIFCAVFQGSFPSSDHTDHQVDQNVNAIAGLFRAPSPGKFPTKILY